MISIKPPGTYPTYKLSLKKIALGLFLLILKAEDLCWKKLESENGLICLNLRVNNVVLLFSDSNCNSFGLFCVRNSDTF